MGWLDRYHLLSGMALDHSRALLNRRDFPRLLDKRVAHAALFFGAGRTALAYSSTGSNSPDLTASIRVSMTVGNRSIVLATIPALPFSRHLRWAGGGALELAARYCR